MKAGHGTRLIPDGTITGAHFLKTPSYVQVTGRGHLKNLHITAGDEGGELDPHGADGSGNPVGGLVYTNAYTGKYERIYECELTDWSTFFSLLGIRSGEYRLTFLPFLHPFRQQGK